jgi:hypothetical protein
MKSPDISPNQPLLSVEDENDVELFSTQKLPSVGRMADDMTYSPGFAEILTPEPSDSNGAADS